MQNLEEVHSLIYKSIFRTKQEQTELLNHNDDNNDNISISRVLYTDQVVVTQL